MCGRYAITTAPEAIRRLFQIPGPTPNFAPHYNAAPGQELPVIRLHPESGDRALGTLRWGLIPYWSKDAKIGWKFINARGETVKMTAAFREAYKRRRCIVPNCALIHLSDVPWLRQNHTHHGQARPWRETQHCSTSGA